MKRLVTMIGILALAAPLALAQSSTWKSDPAHSGVEFGIRHMGLSTVHGRFGKVDGTIVYNEGDVTKSTVTATIDVAGLSTGVEARDNHLKTDAFFDVAKFATATFTSTSVAKSASGLTVTGNLTLHGVTKPVTLDVEGPVTPIESPMDHKLHSGFSATATISRSAFGIGASFPAAILGDDVKLTIELEVVKQ
ncbi:MAG: YceI family protein [Terracidiphilus sp.]